MTIPAYPKAGPAAGEELRKHCFPTLADSGDTVILCPAVAEWLQRLDKFQRQLEGPP